MIKNIQLIKRSSLFILAFFIALIAQAAIVDTINVYSDSMNKEIEVVVVTPVSKKAQSKVESDALPVLYLLHGHGGKYDDWVKRVSSVTELADHYNMIVVCPDGGTNSWYWDSPIDSTYQYETFVSNELTSWIDNNYNTTASREGRAVTGLSMGGHGGLYLGFRNQEVCGACGSMSGGVDIRPFPNNWGMTLRIGTQAENPDYWENYTVMGLLHLLTPGNLKIIIDCGTNDFFYEVNEALHHQLLYRNIPHDYISRPGAHNWDYWENAIKYQMLYFNEFFTAKK